MSTKLTMKPGERVSESGIYEATRSGRRISMRKGQYASKTPTLNEEWEKVIDAKKPRKSRASSTARKNILVVPLV